MKGKAAECVDEVSLSSFPCPIIIPTTLTARASVLSRLPSPEDPVRERISPIGDNRHVLTGYTRMRTRVTSERAAPSPCFNYLLWRIMSEDELNENELSPWLFV
jgi:hypothetical protein